MSRLFEAITQLEDKVKATEPQLPFMEQVGEDKDVGSGGKVPFSARLYIPLFIILASVLASVLALFVLKQLKSPGSFSFLPEIHSVHKVDVPVVKEKTRDVVRSNSFKRDAGVRSVSHDSSSQVKRAHKAIIKRSSLSQAGEKGRISSGAQKKRDLRPNALTRSAYSTKRSLEALLRNSAGLGSSGPLTSKMEPLGQKKDSSRVLSFYQKKMLYQAEALRKQGRIKEALEVYFKIWKEGFNPLVANNLAGLLMETGRYQEAAKILKRALKSAPDDPDIRYNLSQVEAVLKGGL